MKTQCTHCKVQLKAPDGATGKIVKCPKCGQSFTIAPFEQPPPQEVCTECKSAIGPQEQAYVYKGNVVCRKCYNKTQSTEQKSPPPPPPPRDTAVEKKPKSQKQKLSKLFYVYFWAVIRIIAGIGCVLSLALTIKGPGQSILRATFAAAGLLVVCSVLIEIAFFYKMYSAICDSNTSITPLKAVAFLFIPLFNIYWALYMLVGFAEDYNEFIRLKSTKAKSLPVLLFLIYAVTFLLTSLTVTAPMTFMFALVGPVQKAFVSYTLIFWLSFGVVLVVSISHFVVYTIFAMKICNAINALDSPTATNASR